MIQKDQSAIFNNMPITVSMSSDADGQMNFDHGDVHKVLHNLKSFMDSTSSVALIKCTYDVDAFDRIKRIDNASNLSKQNRLEADCLSTDNPEVTLALPVADCIAVAVYDPVNKAAAILHLGWRHSRDLLVKKAVEHMAEEYGSAVKDLLVYFSPSISKKYYVFENIEQKNDSKWQNFVEEQIDGYHLDLKGFNKQQFIDTGVLAKNIEVSNIDTATSSDYGSHYSWKQNPKNSNNRFLLTIKLG